MHRRLALAAASMVLILSVVAACRPVDGGAGGSPSAEPSAAETTTQSNAAPAAPTDAPEETPIATMGSDYGY
jgi:hypothetical protein